MAQFSQDYHFQYLEVHRHWDSNSEQYAGADCLVTALFDGWQIDGNVYFEEHWQAGMRLVMVFYFELRKGEETMTMPVLSNPYARRMLKMLKIKPLPVEEREIARRRQRRVQD